MRRSNKTTLLLIALVLILSVGISGAAKKKSIPSHPDKLKFDKLKFEVPDPADYRFELAEGNTVFIAEDHALPLVNIAMTLRSGSFLDPEGKTGLSGATGMMLRRGGTENLTAEEFDERADFLAANIGSSSGDTSAGASVNCVTQVLDDCLELYFDMLKHPRFQADRLAIEMDNYLESMKQRNDDARSIASREWDWLLHGMTHHASRRMTQANLDAITRDDLVAFHGQYWRPNLMSFAVTGDVKPEEILAKLNAHLADWKVEGPDIPWPPPEPEFTPQPGLYHAEKDIPQGRVNFGHLTYKRDNWEDKDIFAMYIMNDILGGGGFTSRITAKVRSDEGLAYSAGSSISAGLFQSGSFSVYYQSKSPTVALAAQLAMNEITRIREREVTDEELATSKNSYIDTFPARFESPGQIVGTFLYDDYIGRPVSYWQNYRKNYEAVDADAVRKAANKHLHPDNMIFLIVGKWEDIEGGDADGRASMKEFHEGKVTHLPERDPLTLQPTQE
jgi:zinc protease